MESWAPHCHVCTVKQGGVVKGTHAFMGIVRIRPCGDVHNHHIDLVPRIRLVIPAFRGDNCDSNVIDVLIQRILRMPSAAP